MDYGPPWWGPVYFRGFALSFSPRSLGGFVVLMLILVRGLPASTVTEQKVPGVADGLYRLHLFHTHTGERLTIVCRGGEG